MHPANPRDTHGRKLDAIASHFDANTADTSPYLLSVREQEYLLSLVKYAANRKACLARALANALLHFGEPQKREAARLLLLSMANGYDEGPNHLNSYKREVKNEEKQGADAER